MHSLFPLYGPRDFSVHPRVGMSGGCHLRWYPLFDGLHDCRLQTFPGLINTLMSLDGDGETLVILYALHISPLPEINLSSRRLGACGFDCGVEEHLVMDTAAYWWHRFTSLFETWMG